MKMASMISAGDRLAGVDVSEVMDGDHVALSRAISMQLQVDVEEADDEVYRKRIKLILSRHLFVRTRRRVLTKHPW